MGGTLADTHQEPEDPLEICAGKLLRPFFGRIWPLHLSTAICRLCNSSTRRIRMAIWENTEHLRKKGIKEIIHTVLLVSHGSHEMHSMTASQCRIQPRNLLESNAMIDKMLWADHRDHTCSEVYVMGS